MARRFQSDAHFSQRRQKSRFHVRFARLIQNRSSLPLPKKATLSRFEVAPFLETPLDRRSVIEIAARVQLRPANSTRRRPARSRGERLHRVFGANARSIRRSFRARAEDSSRAPSV